VAIGQQANLPKPSFVQLDNIHTLARSDSSSISARWIARRGARSAGG
jgi:hypothetical protein